jgi:hypothetical protein
MLVTAIAILCVEIITLFSSSLEAIAAHSRALGSIVASGALPATLYLATNVTPIVRESTPIITLLSWTIHCAITTNNPPTRGSRQWAHKSTFQFTLHGATVVTKCVAIVTIFYTSHHSAIATLGFAHRFALEHHFDLPQLMKDRFRCTFPSHLAFALSRTAITILRVAIVTDLRGCQQSITALDSSTLGCTVDRVIAPEATVNLAGLRATI